MSNRRVPITFTVESVFARIRQAPIGWSELAGSRDATVRRRLRPIVEGLLASGAVEVIRFGGRRLLAAAGWKPTKAQLLQDLYDRCRAIDGCMLWAGHIDTRRGPVAYAGWGGTERSVRRRIWANVRRPLDYSHSIAMTCENPESCVLFEHMKPVSRGIKMEGKPKTLAHRRAIATGKRRSAKLDEMKVERIRSSEKSGRSLAREMKVSATTVSKVRKNDRWRNYRATPFSGLEAANDPGRQQA